MYWQNKNRSLISIYFFNLSAISEACRQRFLVLIKLYITYSHLNGMDRALKKQDCIMWCLYTMKENRQCPTELRHHSHNALGLRQT